MTSESQPARVWANGDQTSEGVIVDTDGNEALLELHNGEYGVRLVKDLKPVPAPVTVVTPFTAEEEEEMDRRLAGEPAVETLTCQAGQHEWTRPKGGRGRKPLNCPEHQPVDDEPEVQTLTCKQGHEWTRPAQRGALPQWCPEHKPQPRRPAQARTEAHSTPNGVNGEVTSEVGKVRSEALAILAGRTRQELVQAHDELGLKLAYVVETLAHPGERESGDISSLLRRQKELIHEYSRTHRHG